MQKNKYLALCIYCIFSAFNFASALSITNTGEEDLYATFKNPITGSEVYKTQIPPGTKENPTTRTINYNFSTNTVDILLFYRIPARVTAVYSTSTNSTCNIMAIPVQCRFWEIWCSETKPYLQIKCQCNNPSIE